MILRFQPSVVEACPPIDAPMLGISTLRLVDVVTPATRFTEVDIEELSGGDMPGETDRPADTEPEVICTCDGRAN